MSISPVPTSASSSAPSLRCPVPVASVAPPPIAGQYPVRPRRYLPHRPLLCLQGCIPRSVLQSCAVLRRDSRRFDLLWLPRHCESARHPSAVDDPPWTSILYTSVETSRFRRPLIIGAPL